MLWSVLWVRVEEAAALGATLPDSEEAESPVGSSAFLLKCLVFFLLSEHCHRPFRRFSTMSHTRIVGGNRRGTAQATDGRLSVRRRLTALERNQRDRHASRREPPIERDRRPATVLAHAIGCKRELVCKNGRSSWSYGFLDVCSVNPVAESQPAEERCRLQEFFLCVAEFVNISVQAERLDLVRERAMIVRPGGGPGGGLLDSQEIFRRVDQAFRSYVALWHDGLRLLP